MRESHSFQYIELLIVNARNHPIKYQQRITVSIICGLLATGMIAVDYAYAESSVANPVNEPVLLKVERGEDPATGLKYWLWDHNGFYLRLTQRLPDQTRAYFEARGFNQASAEILATSCVFQTMVKNTGTEPGSKIDAKLSDWQVVSDGKQQAMLLREHWQKTWQQNKLPESALIALEWSLLPSQIIYDINDYNWGMSSYGLPPGSTFDLIFSWNRNGKSYQGRINDVICAEDIHLDPPGQ